MMKKTAFFSSQTGFTRFLKKIEKTILGVNKPMNYAHLENLVHDYNAGQPVEQELYKQLDKLFRTFQKIKPYFTKKSGIEDMKITFITKCFHAFPQYNKAISNIKNYCYVIYERNYVAEIMFHQLPKRDYRKESFSLDDTLTEEEGSSTFAERLISDESYDLNPSVILEKQEEYKRLKERMSHILSEIERDCLLMNYVENYSYEEIAENLGVEIKSVDNALQRGKNKLKKGFSLAH